MMKTICLFAASNRHRPFAAIFATLAFTGLMPLSSYAQHGHHHQNVQSPTPPAFIASTAKPFASLMDDAMAVMEDGMKRAPMNGAAGHDFVTMMIPHHQGAIDMAKAVLLYSQDPELRNLAQGIIAEQQNEINVMRAWLQRYQAQNSNASRIAK